MKNMSGKLLIAFLIFGSLSVAAIAIVAGSDTKAPKIATVTPEAARFTPWAHQPVEEKKAAGLSVSGPYSLKDSSQPLPTVLITVSSGAVTLFCDGQKFMISVIDHQANVVIPTLQDVTTTKSFPVYEFTTSTCNFSIGISASDGLPEMYFFSGP